MKHMLRLSLSLAVLLNTTVNAQNWLVGVPVDATLSQLTMYGAGCTPNFDEAFNFPSSPVSGVDYIAIVTQVSPSGSITVSPGPTAALALGDTIWIDNEVTRFVAFPSGSGSVTLVFKAIGTPTTIGQAHPCSESDFWMSDLGICPETLSLNLTNGCVTDNSTAVGAVASAGTWFTMPSASNGYRAELRMVVPGSIQVLDVQGRVVSVPQGSEAHGGSVDMAAVPDGIYLLRAIGLNGLPLVGRFTLVH
jgi:hypothetical protein